ncbi:hypothetical protein MSPP1_001606 [Malassezia sp. CBS 17886]|nr:hypothetical protein MSPP1_001606 [Malassezia sp. CBS 17886]
MSTALDTGLWPNCSVDVFKAYHDPSVHIMLSVIFGIFFLVFAWYAIAHRPKIEYSFMAAFCALELAAFVIRINFDFIDFGIALIVYTAAVAVSVCVMYLLYGRWSVIADQYYDKRKFNLCMHNPIFLSIFFLAMLGTVIAGIWVPTIMWVVFLALFISIWVTTLVALVQLRWRRPAERERVYFFNQSERKFGLIPLSTTHRHLDNMLVVLIVLNSILLVKAIFLLVAFVLVFLFLISPLYYVFAIIPDLALCVILASPEVMPLYEPSRYESGARENAEVSERADSVPTAISTHGGAGAQQAPVPTGTYASEEPYASPLQTDASTAQPVVDETYRGNADMRPVTSDVAPVMEGGQPVLVPHMSDAQPYPTAVTRD